MTVIVTRLSCWLRRNVRGARLAGLSTAFVCSISGTAWADQYLRFCNTGDTALHMARISESQLTPLSERTAKFAGWDMILPGDCSRWYTIYIKTHFAFVHRLADGTVGNPVYIPTSTANTRKGLLKHFCVPLSNNWEENGPLDQIVARYTGATCPTGLTRIESSVGAGYGQGDIEKTLKVDGSYDGLEPIVGRWKKPFADAPPPAAAPSQLPPAAAPSRSPPAAARPAAAPPRSPFVMIGDRLMSNDGTLQMSINRDVWENPALIRSGGKTYRASDIMRVFNKKNVVCTGASLIQTRIDFFSCPALVFSSEAGQVVLAVRNAPPRGANSSSHVYVEQMSASHLVALIDAWGGGPGNREAATDELSRIDALSAVARDRMLQGADYRALRPLFAAPPTFAVLEAQLDKLLAANGGLLKQAYDRRQKLLPYD